MIKDTTGRAHASIQEPPTADDVGFGVGLDQVWTFFSFPFLLTKEGSPSTAQRPCAAPHGRRKPAGRDPKPSRGRILLPSNSRTTQPTLPDVVLSFPTPGMLPQGLARRDRQPASLCTTLTSHSHSFVRTIGSGMEPLVRSVAHQRQHDSIIRIPAQKCLQNIENGQTGSSLLTKLYLTNH